MSEIETSELTNIPDHWQVSNMANETEFITDYVANGSFASLAENVYYKSEPDYAILIRLTDFNNNYKGDFVYVDKKAYDFLRKSKLVGGELIISNVGAYAGTVFLTPNLNRPMTLGPNSIMMNFKNGNTFYYYWLKSPMGKFLLEGIISGSAQPKFNKTTFRQMQVPVPPLREQTAIASVLSSLDDKIDLLNRQNATLEKMAETLFRQWFVEEAKEEWEEERLSKFISVKHGFAFKGEDIVGYPTEFILVTPGNFKIGGGFKSGKFKYLKNTKFPDSYIFKSGDLIVTMTDLSVDGATLGYPAMIPVEYGNEKYLHNQRVGKVEFKKELSKFFLYFLMKTDEYQWFVLSGASGTSIRHTSPNSITSFEFKLPPFEYQMKFEKIVSEFFNKMNKNQTQIRTLTAMRDNILPKLMSGEVRVDI